jgi:hypothetical protein
MGAALLQVLLNSPKDTKTTTIVLVLLGLFVFLIFREFLKANKN